MDDPPRPAMTRRAGSASGVGPTIAERALAGLAFVGPGRLASAALSMVVVAVGCWWLLRAPAPPVEQDLPFTPGASVAPPTDSTGSASDVPGSESSGSSSAGAADPSADPSPAASIVVQVAGAVVSPGVYTMPAGAREGDHLVHAGSGGHRVHAG